MRGDLPSGRGHPAPPSVWSYVAEPGNGSTAGGISRMGPDGSLRSSVAGRGVAGDLGQPEGAGVPGGKHDGQCRRDQWPHPFRLGDGELFQTRQRPVE